MQANAFAVTTLGRHLKSRPSVVGIITAILVGLLAGQAMAVTSITDVNVMNKPDRVVISVSGSAPLKMAVLSSSSGHYLGFQFAGRLAAKGRLVSIHGGRISNVRYSRYQENPPLARVVLNTSSHLDYSTQWNDDRTQVRITVWKFGASPDRAPHQPSAGVKQVKATRGPQPAVDLLPMLPPTEIRGPQGSEPGKPAEPVSAMPNAAPMPVVRVDAPVVRVARTPVMPADPVSAVPKATPMRVVRVAPALVRVARTPAMPASSGAGKKVSLNFLGADINDVLKALATQSGENIVASKDVKGEVTVSLSDVTLEEALDYVAKLSGFGYIKSNGTYLVGTKDALRSMTGEVSVLSTSEVVPVKYTNCDDVLALIKAQCPDVQATKVSMRGANKSAANTQGPEPESSIVLTGPPASIAGAKLLVQQVDIPGENDQATYKVMYVDPDLLAKTLRRLVPAVYVEGLGMTTASGGDSGGAGAAGAATAPAAAGQGASSGQGMTTTNMDPAALDNLSRTLVITGRKGDVEKARTLIEALDVRSPQIKIEAKITSLTESGEKKLGLSWSWGSFSMLEMSPSHWQRQPIDFGATLDALITNGDGRLLAAPSLVCLEGKPGMFFVGDQIRFVTQISAGNNGAPTVTTDTANVGVQLSVVGNVASDGYITLNLHPEVSTLKLDQKVDSKDIALTLPRITRRYTDHVVRVKTGETIVIGGLILDDELDTLNKVPLLGDLPVLGHLFRHRVKTKEHSEVVIFITASIVND